MRIVLGRSSIAYENVNLNNDDALTVRSHLVNQFPAKVVQSGPILTRPGPAAGSGGSKTFLRGSQVTIVSSACKE